MTFHIFGKIIPTDELIFFRGIETTNQYHFKWDKLAIVIVTTLKRATTVGFFSSTSTSGRVNPATCFSPPG